MALARYIVGIDLGTTHTVVAYADSQSLVDGRPSVHTLAIPQLVAPGQVAERDLLASARYHPADGELPEGTTDLPWGRDAFGGIVGQLALTAGAQVPARFVQSTKSWLCHAAVDRTAAILPWGAPAEVAKISPVDASASFLAHVRAAWDYKHPDAPLAEQDVVLTIPASFDEAARALTLAAAEKAGLGPLRLVEEPQAAFYDWLERHSADAETALADTKVALVVDVGGGTTDLTLIGVELRESGPRLTRTAVGDHLMLGGDNMDLLLARHLEPQIGGGDALGTGRFAQLLEQSRRAKEKLLSDNASASAPITVLGGGSKLIGGARTTQLERASVEGLVLDGFFPRVPADELPQRRSGGLMEFGLPYVSDPAVTRHVAAFLRTHADLVREGLRDRASAAIPDTVLMNGGVFLGAALRDRLVEVLSSWRGSKVRVLDNPHPSLAVARGAVAYGLARRGVGIRIGGGSARAFFLVLGGAKANEPDAVCILPAGAEEGEEKELTERTFSLQVGRPARFVVASSTSDVRHHRPGELIELDQRHHRLPEIAAVLAPKEGAAERQEIPVRIVSALTEIGTLELGLVRTDRETERWKLEFQLRGGASAGAIEQVRQLHPRFGEATERIRRVYGKGTDAVGSKEVKALRAELERILGDRDKWDSPLLRELFGALFGGVKRRRRSADHERVWFNLTGYALRPGFGYPLDDYRIGELWTIWTEGVQYAPEAQNWAEWWILWRRVAAGLDAAKQEAILADLEWYFEPEGPRPRPRPPGPKKLGYDDMVRLVGSLEHPAPEHKERVGTWLLDRMSKGGESAQTWWAIGRLGARVPFYGSAHRVISANTASAWLERALSVPWKSGDAVAFAATQLGRVSGDRARDLDEGLRQRLSDRLAQTDAPASWRRMVTEVTRLDASDERRVFGESLPPGLRLL